MGVYQTLLTVAAIAGAITAIYVFITKVYRKIKKCVNFFTGMSRRIEQIEVHTTRNYMKCLQLVIMSDEMPIEERLRAGEDYINHHGNGAVKAKYKTLQNEYEKERQK